MKLIYTMNIKYILLFLCLIDVVLLRAQDDKIKFGAYGRAFQTQNKMDAADTVNADRNSTGHVLIDLGVNINPDRRTEIQAILRFKSDLAGFYGAGTAAQLRQAFIRGILGKFVNYEVGDLYFKLSPFTFYNNNAEGQVNEAKIFSDLRRDFTNYENRSNRGNYWWQQGAHANFGLDFKESFIQNIRFDVFFLRNRTSNYFNAPSIFHSGGRFMVTQSDRLKLAVNYLNLFDVGATIDNTNQSRNPVTSLELNYTILSNASLGVNLFGEGGYSKLVFLGDSVKSDHDKHGYFYEAGTGLDLKSAGISFKASYLYVDPQFFSSGAQTKRINFSKMPSVFPFYGNDPLNPYQRNATIFDLVRDTALYNPIIRPQLMAYDPTLNNSQPYGKATPNRTGLNFGIIRKDSLEKVVVDLDAAYLMEAVTAGGTEKRKFMVAKASIDFNIHKIIGFKKRFAITTGVRYEKTNRGGVAPVSLNSNLVDAGLELEILKKFDLLFGWKMLMAKGNEYILVRNRMNDIISYNNSFTNNINVRQNLYAFGVKYRFTEKTYLTVQYTTFNFTDKVALGADYTINQVLMMFTMNF